VLDDAVCRRLFDYKPQNISNTLWAWATLGHVPGPEMCVSLESFRLGQETRSGDERTNNSIKETEVVAQKSVHIMQAMSMLMQPTLRNFTPQVCSFYLPATWMFMKVFLGSVFRTFVVFRT
jgi:hypothetical protein